MFKNYLRIQPPAIQLLILLSFWSVLQILFYSALPTVVKLVSGIQFADFNKFFAEEIYKYPSLLIGLNATGAIFMFLLPAIIFAYLADPEPRAYLGLVKPNKPVQIVLIILLSLALIPVITIIGSWIKQLNLGDYSNKLDEQRNKVIQSYLISGSVTKMLTNVFFIALIPAVCEELFFRGVVQRFAHTWFKKWWISIGISGLVFAAFHASISEFVPILMAGLILGWVYYITGSLWLSILLHLLNNGLQVVLAYFASGSQDFENFDKQAISLLSTFAIALVAMIVLIIRLIKNKTPLPNNWTVVHTETDERAEIQ